MLTIAPDGWSAFFNLENSLRCLFIIAPGYVIETVSKARWHRQVPQHSTPRLFREARAFIWYNADRHASLCYILG